VTIADDEGRLRGNPTWLAGRLYAYDRETVNGETVAGWLQELEAEHLIHRYQVESRHYVQITNWREHQKIDHPAKSRLPAPRRAKDSDGLAKDSESLARPSESLATDLNQYLNLGPRTLRAPPRFAGVIASAALRRPRQGARSRDRRFVYFKRGTFEFEAYAHELTTRNGDPPAATSDGRWFRYLQ
jgi:hypothetical protein